VNCFHCERPAHAGCVYCGRAVCRDHIKSLPHPLSTFRDQAGRLMALVTPEAVHCGHCMPHGRPVHLESIDDALAVDAPMNVPADTMPADTMSAGVS
jgi:hypothetical protein